MGHLWEYYIPFGATLPKIGQYNRKFHPYVQNTGIEGLFIWIDSVFESQGLNGRVRFEGYGIYTAENLDGLSRIIRRIKAYTFKKIYLQQPRTVIQNKQK